MQTVAIVIGGRVANLAVVADGSDWVPDVGEPIPATADVQIGWTWDGVNFAPPVPPSPAVPAEVQLWQARAVLDQMGLLATVNAAVAASENPALRAVWEYGSVITRSSPGLAALAKAVSLNDAQVDDLFRAAAVLVV
jgi:hypothetical protein